MPIRITNKDFLSAAKAMDNLNVIQTQHVIAQAIAAERERCAEVAEHLNGWGSAKRGKERAAELAAHIAKMIRQG